MTSPSRFDPGILEQARKAKIIGVRAGRQPHRFIGLWVVVAQNRVFVRSWSLSANGWYQTLLEQAEGTIEIANRRVRVRAIRTRSEKLKDLVDAAYAQKYNTPSALRYVRDLQRARSRNATIELVPQRKSRRTGPRH